MCVCAVSQAVSGINSCLSEGSDPAVTLQALQNQFAGLGFIDESVGERYHVALQHARTEKGEVSSRRPSSSRL